MSNVKDLPSCDFYHGPISRQVAVSLLESDGDFLIRDCISNPGDYVLTCMADDGKVLHFKLNKTLVGKEPHYQFEGELFPSVFELVMHHVMTGEPVSSSSNAVISSPKACSRLCSLSSTRSQSSLSGDTTTGSTVSSGGGSIGLSANQPFSGSRASLLKENKEPSENNQLKRLKSLPTAKGRRVKRRAPSPPKNQKPLLRPNTEENAKEVVLAVPKANEKKVPSLLEGVRLRRKKFAYLLPKPISFRQSMHITAGLQDHLRKGLTEEKRRYSMPRLLDDSEEDDSTASVISHSKLVRSPSDSSLIYLNQVNQMKHKNGPPRLPEKQRSRSREAILESTGPQQHHASEALYDCLPTPRPCLTQQQMQYNAIYDVPRNLVVPQRFDEFQARSVSAFGPHVSSHTRSRRQPLDCQSVCSFKGSNGSSGLLDHEQRKLNRHRNFDEGLNHNQENFKPALPPKSQNNRQIRRRRRINAQEEDIYNIPRKLEADDAISLCSSFSYCSECTNTSTGLTSSTGGCTITEDSSSRYSEEATPFRFSPTSWLSEHSLNIQDFDEETDIAAHHSHLAMSSVSSVSSITLQGDDISLGYDTTSLPDENPFPEGLPSSASSTIGSPVSSSRSSYSLTTEDYKHDDGLTTTISEPLLAEVEAEEAQNQITRQETPEDEASEKKSQTDIDISRHETNDDETHHEEPEHQRHIELEEVPDIFNHRSSSRAILRPKNGRCKSQPDSLHVSIDSVWVANGGTDVGKERKSLSPSMLKMQHEEKDPVVSKDCSSIFDPSSFLTLYLPGSGSNKPLDPMAVSLVHRTLVDTPAPILAVHLARVDLGLLGLFPSSDNENHLKRLGNDAQWNCDMLERYFCMRTFVLVTILAASNISESARVLAKWIRVADETYKRLKNYFGFHCVAAGLIGSPHLIGWNQLWSELRQSFPTEWGLINEPLRSMMQRVTANGMKMHDACVPDIVPIVLALNDSSAAMVQKEATSYSGISAKEDAKICLAMTELFKKNAATAFRHIKCSDDLLIDLFRTEFHVRLFWGSNGVAAYPNNFNERHEKFARVLSALAAICAHQF